MQKVLAGLCLAVFVLFAANPAVGGTRTRRPPSSSRKAPALTPAQAILGGILASIAFEVTRNVADRLTKDAYRQRKTVAYDDPSGVKVQARPVRHYQRPLPVETPNRDPVPADNVRGNDGGAIPGLKSEETGNPAADVPENNPVVKTDRPIEQQIGPAAEQSADHVLITRDAESEKNKAQSGYDPEWASSRDSMLKAYRELDPETLSRMPPETGMEPVVVKTEIDPAKAVATPVITEAPSPAKQKLPEKKLANNKVRSQNCSEIEITTFKDGKVVGTELREVCE